MNTCIRTSVVLLTGLVLTAKVNAQQSAKAMELVKDAIRAHGGVLAMNRAQLIQRSGTGTTNVLGQETPLKDELQADLPKRCRLTYELGASGDRGRFIFCVDGDKGWQSTGTLTTELPKDRLDELREEVYVLWLATLVPITRERSMDLSLLPETKIQGQPAAGVQVSSTGHPDVRLYFDMKTGLLIAIQRQATQAGIKVDKEYQFSAHKDFSGILLPTRYVELVGGRKLMEFTTIDYRFPSKLDEAKFAKP